jgi:flotillin
MSVEKLEFLLPAVMTIGPKIDLRSLEKYARLMTGKAKSNVPELVKGVIEGETRVIAAGMSMEEIFKVGTRVYITRLVLAILTFSIYVGSQSVQGKYH